MKKYFFKIAILFISIAVFIFCSYAFAQEEDNSPPGNNVIDEEEMASPTDPGNVTMDFKDADINNVLRVLSYKSGVNIIAGPEVEGLVTVRLTNVPWEKALDVVLRTYGFAYEREGNIIRVTTVENLKQEELTTEVFTINFGKAENVTESIKEMLSERGKVRFDDRSNTLIITDIPTNLYKMGNVIERLDKKTPQVLIESKIIETSLDDDENLGINWTIGATARAAARPITYPFEKDSKSKYWEDDFATASSSSFTFGTLNFSSFQAVMEILKARTDTNIVSNPRIVTLNNQEAKVVVASTFNIPTYERNESTGGMEITGYTEKDIGVTLTVTPHVNAEGDIVVDLVPEVSAFLQFDTIGGIQAPRFSTRSAQTQVMVKDGETIVIGGLVKQTVIEYNKKVPLLGDIPIVKYLFTKKEKAIDKTDLLFFITTSILKEPVEIANLYSNEGMLQQSEEAK